jgi:hypothetical protein
VIGSIEAEDPEVRERQRHLVKLLLARDPEMVRALEDRARIAEARAMLRRVLARRGLPLRPEDEARIDACTTLLTLEHWLDEAVVAKSAGEALRSSSRGTRSAPGTRARKSSTSRKSPPAAEPSAPPSRS